MSPLRERMNRIIFESDTPAGRAFDVALLWAIVFSVALVILDSVPEVHMVTGPWLWTLEWGFTILFTVEYVLRLYSSRSRRGYAFSFFGIVDLLSILPSYMALFFPGAQSFMLVRAMRLIRLFRILKLGRYSREAQILVLALRNSREKIAVFLYAVVTVVVAVGALMYFVEGEKNGFTNIPVSMYWAVVTLTTVGYGDISPVTALGRLIASGVMILGYGLIAVPTGIVAVEINEAAKAVPTGDRSCPTCGATGHTTDARYCRLCGRPMA